MGLESVRCVAAPSVLGAMRTQLQVVGRALGSRSGVSGRQLEWCHGRVPNVAGCHVAGHRVAACHVPGCHVARRHVWRDALCGEMLWRDAMCEAPCGATGCGETSCGDTSRGETSCGETPRGESPRTPGRPGLTQATQNKAPFRLASQGVKFPPQVYDRSL